MSVSADNHTLKAVRRVPAHLAGGSRYFPCPLTGNRTQLCFSLCRPVGGIGDCGRTAGHAQLSRIQRGILDHLRRTGSVGGPLRP
jgi:hypothetical protein